MGFSIAATSGPRETCVLCRREMPKSALIAKTMFNLAGRAVTRFYCTDALACIEATRLIARHPS